MSGTFICKIKRGGAAPSATLNDDKYYFKYYNSYTYFNLYRIFYSM